MTDNQQIINRLRYNMRQSDFPSTFWLEQITTLAKMLNASDNDKPRDLSPEGYRAGHRKLVAMLEHYNYVLSLENDPDEFYADASNHVEPAK